MSRQDVLELTGWVGSRVQSMRMLIRHWFDDAGGIKAALRFYSGRRREELLKRVDDLRPPQEYFYALRYEYPDRAAQWSSSPDTFPESEWGGQDPYDHPPPAIPVPILPPSEAVPQGPSATSAGALLPRHVLPDFENLFDPGTAEILEPVEVLDALEFDIVGTESFLDREAIHLRGVIGRPSEVGIHLTAADAYDSLVDAESGIMLRHACLVDGVEFEVAEVRSLELSFFSRPLWPPS